MAGRYGQTVTMQQTMDHPMSDHSGTGHGDNGRRKGLRRTIAVLVAIALIIYLLTFVQILLMK